MNKKQDIIKEVEHYINGKYNLGIIDDKVVKDCINKTLEAINYTRCCTELKSKECPMCNEEKDCEGHNVCEDCGGRSF
jgi:hypothetical protein